MQLYTPSVLADLGGTNARLAVLASDGSLRLERRYLCADFSSIPAVINAYLATLPAPTPQRLCITVAGPILFGRLAFSNLPHWSTNLAEVQGAFSVWGIPGHNVTMVNDMAAIALGVPHMPTRQLQWLNFPPPAMASERLAVVGLGTGFGLSFLDPAPNLPGGWRVIDGEGGHTALAGRTPEQRQVIDKLYALLGNDDIITIEKVIAGIGLPNLYAAVTGGEKLDAAGIVARAAEGEPAAQTTMRLMVEFLAIKIADTCALSKATTVLLNGGVVDKAMAAGVFNVQHLLAHLVAGGRGGFSGIMPRVAIGTIAGEVPAFNGLKELCRV